MEVWAAQALDRQAKDLIVLHTFRFTFINLPANFQVVA